MAIIRSNKTTIIQEDAKGNLTTETVEMTTKVERLREPDFIKLYTKVWCEFNQIPTQWRPLFLELIARMTYADSSDLEHSQIVATGGVTRDSICKALNWKPNMYQKGLKALKDVGAIKQKMKGFYQINPNYAGRGEWKYNPKLERGGVEALKATFDFNTHNVEVDIKWADTNPIEPPTIVSNSPQGIDTPNNAECSTKPIEAPTTNDMTNDSLDGQMTFEDFNI